MEPTRKRRTEIAMTAVNRKRRFAASIWVAVLAGLPLAYLGAGAYLALRVTQPKRTAQVLLSNGEIQEIQILSRDGLKLAAWFLATDSARAIILAHGLSSCRACEFGGRFVEFAAHLRAAGFNVLMIDLRAHGESEGEHVTFGLQEKGDILGALNWLHSRGFQEIGALGVSLGAASIVAAAIDPHGGQDLHALVLDSCFNTLPDLLYKNFAEETRYPAFLLPGGFVMARLLLKVNLASVQPVRDLPGIRAPLMLVYGGRDRYLSPSMIRQMTGAHAGADLWISPDAEHAGIYGAHPQEYVKRVGTFFDNSLR